MPFGGGVAFSPLALFAASEVGVWYDPSDFSTMFQDDAGATPVTAVGQSVGRINDKSGNGYFAYQNTPTTRPVLGQEPGGQYYLEFDGVDDFLVSFFTITQPFQRVSGLRLLTGFGINQQIIGGRVENIALYASGATQLALFADAVLAGPTVAINTPYVITELFNGASSSIQNGNNAATTGNAGTSGTSGLTIAAGFTNTGNAPIRLYSLVQVSRALTAAELTTLKAWTAAKTGVSL